MKFKGIEWEEVSYEEWFSYNGQSIKELRYWNGAEWEYYLSKRRKKKKKCSKCGQELKDGQDN